MDRAAALVRRARAAGGLSLRRMADLAGTSHATIAAYEAGRVHPSVSTIERIARAVGFRLAMELVPVAGDPGRPRGDELVQVLDLVAHFPARHARHLRYPKFGMQ